MEKDYASPAYYRMALESVSCYYAEVMRFMAKAREHKDFSMRRLAYAGEQFRDWKTELLKCKEAQQFPGGTDFLTEDNLFLLFDIEGGRLTRGEKDDVFAVTEKWVSGFPGKFNPHNFEVAIFSRALADPYYFTPEELYPESILNARETAAAPAADAEEKPIKPAGPAEMPKMAAKSTAPKQTASVSKKARTGLKWYQKGISFGKRRRKAA